MMMRHVRARITYLAIASAAAAGTVGCDRNPRLADTDIRSVTVRPVTHYGITLDDTATPEQTTFVLLKAMREDFHASNDAQRKAALDVLFDVAAADAIVARTLTSLNRDEVIHQIVNRWTPTVSHYVDDFDTEWEPVLDRFVRVGPKLVGNAGFDVHECQILMEVGDGGGDLRDQVLLAVSLIQEQGLWRVQQVGFVADTRLLPDTMTRARDAVEVVSSPAN